MTAVTFKSPALKSATGLVAVPAVCLNTRTNQLRSGAQGGGLQ